MLINVVSTTIAAATSSSYPNCTANTEDIDAQGHASRIITTSATIPLILNILKIAMHTTGIMNILTIIAKYTNHKVVFELPDEVERAGYSKATKARLNGEKLKKLGWKARYDMKSGLERTLEMLKTKED